MGSVKLNQAIIDDMVELIVKGNFVKTACGACGISIPAHYRWMRKGQDGVAPIYVKYFQAITRAEANAEVEAVNVWKKAMPGDWRAAKDFLKTRFSKDWAPPANVNIQHQGVAGPHMLGANFDFTRLTDEEMDQLEQLVRKATVTPTNQDGEGVPSLKQLY